MDVDTGDSPLVSSRPYTLILKHYKWVQKEIESLECVGIITKSMSPWASPIVIIPKKSASGEPPKRRLCVDFRKVNKLQQQVITEGKSKGQIFIHPLPKIDQMYAKLKGAKVFSTKDLRSGYHHIALGKDSRAKTAFVTPFGKYEFLMVPFGLAQAQPDKLDTIKNMPVPKAAKEIKQFLGLTGYYRKFVPRFADISRPLTQLMKKEMKFMWTPECQKSFELLKSFLCGGPILKYPDTSKPYTLYTDASKYGWAGVLTQSHTSVIDGKSVTPDHPVTFVIGLFRGSQLNWAALTKEAYTIYMSIKCCHFI